MRDHGNQIEQGRTCSTTTGIGWRNLLLGTWETSGKEPFEMANSDYNFPLLFQHTSNECPCGWCWKICASTTMVSLKFPLQDPLQQVASVNTTTISSKLNCFIKQAGVFDHPKFTRNCLASDLVVNRRRSVCRIDKEEAHGRSITKIDRCQRSKPHHVECEAIEAREDSRFWERAKWRGLRNWSAWCR